MVRSPGLQGQMVDSARAVPVSASVYNPPIASDRSAFLGRAPRLVSTGAPPEGDERARALPRARQVLRGPTSRHGTRMVDFLPGPVAIHGDVQRALLERPESHRSPSFRTSFASTQALLCLAAGARHAEILLGSGTLANDAIAGQLSLL